MLGPDEVRSLKILVEKLSFWDYRAIVRLQIKNNNLGIFKNTLNNGQPMRFTMIQLIANAMLLTKAKNIFSFIFFLTFAVLQK